MGIRLFIAFFFAAAVAFQVSAGAGAAEVNKQPKFSPGPSGLALPRFESLKANKTNLRIGPGLRYPIAWVYQRPGLPVMIIQEFDYWRKVRNVDGGVGWVHKSLIRGRRTAYVTGKVRTLRVQPNESAAAVARAEPGVIARLLACKGAWCRISADGHEGWLKRDSFFGALPNEAFD